MDSKGKNTEAKLTLLPPEILANLAVLPGSEKAQRMTVTSGRRCLESYAKSGPLGSLEKILLGESRWTSTMCYLTWRARAMKRGHLLFQLVPSTPRIDETDSILLPTMTSTDSHGHGYQYQNGDRNKQRLTLAGVAKLLPTPASSDSHSPNCGEHHLARKGARSLRLNHYLWLLKEILAPTPLASISKQSSKTQGGIKRILAGMKTGLKLQPHFVEWMMGFPVGWLDLKPSEIPKSRSKSSHSCGA